MGTLDGRVAIVTGAGRGIGAGVAKLLAAEGAQVVVNDLGGEVDGSGEAAGPADETVAAIKDAGGEAVANYSSVVDHSASEGLVQQALDTYGKLDILANVAGNLRDRMVFNMTEEEWDAVIAVHLKGTFNTSKHASIHWRAERAGHYRLINFTSLSGIDGAPGQPNYAAAKLGIVGFTYSCANALVRYGVTSNAISPGGATRMGATIPQDRRIGGSATENEMAPENVAPAVAYIAGERSDWLNGKVVGASGYQVSVYNDLAVTRQLLTSDGWDLDVLFNKFETVFRPAVERRNYFAPPAEAAS